MLVSLSLPLAACASAATAAPAARAPNVPELHSLDETRALSLIDELLLEVEQQPRNGGFRVALPRHGGLDVDVRLGDSAFGIEWVSDRDRLAYGDRLPPPDPDGQLRVLRADDSQGQQVLILVLDHESYRFASDARSAPEVGDEHDAEQRLRRDLLAFVEYTKSQVEL
jgi:hypothetical protein